MSDTNNTNSKGRFGRYGGQYVPETLMNAVNELEEAYNHYKDDPEFNKELTDLLNNYVGRPSLLYYAEKMTKDLGGAKVYLKREDLNHTGSHKLNNAMGQVLLAKKMGKTRVIAETGAGQHGVATATAAALMGMECEVFMGKEDCQRQALNVFRMELLGAKVHPVTSGTMTLKDAVNETMKEWTNRIDDTHYVLGSVMGPHPFPTIVRDFQAIIGKEIKEQLMEKEGKLPDAVIACVGGGSNAIGAFYNFIEDKDVKLIGCEAAGLGVDNPKNAATSAVGYEGIDIDMSDFSDQALTMAVVAAFGKTETRIRNIGHIRGQESDRVQVIVNELNRMGCDAKIVEEGGSTDVIITPGKLHGAEIETYDDHRVAMSFAVAGLAVDGIVIKNPMCCRKTFENYFGVLETIEKEDE